MLKNKWNTPEGTRDLLFEDCMARRQVESRIKELLLNRGFSEIITPGIEFYDVFASEAHGIAQEKMYKLSDRKGRLLAVKPDLTMPVARVAATRLKGQTRPLRLYYDQPIYTASQALTGRSDETAQIGIEIIGAGGRRTDLEVLVLAVEALQSCGLTDFRMEIGHIGIFNALIRRMNLSDEDAEEIRNLIQAKNFPSLNDLLDRMADRETAGMLKQLPAMFGGEEVLDQAEELLRFPEIAADIQALRSIYSALSQLGLGDKIAIDLGIVNRNDYYTGVVFRGYVEGLGTTALVGGRYDTLLADYGAPEPAIGFSIDADAVARVLKSSLPGMPVPDVLVYADEGYEVKALLEIRKLAAHGFTSEFSVFNSFDESRRYAQKKGIRTVYLVNDDLVEVRL